MKKIKVLTFALTLLVSISNANPYMEDVRDELSLGIKAGINYSNVYDEEGESFEADSKFGFAGGLFLAIPVGKYLGVQPELLFSQKGFQGSGKIVGIPYTFTRTTTYIDVPILIAFKPIPIFSLLAGPQYSFLVKQSDVFTNTYFTINEEQEFENDNIRRNIFCFLGGFDLNFNKIILGTRVGWDILNNNGDGTTTTPRYKNVWNQITIGFKL